MQNKDKKQVRQTKIKNRKKGGKIKQNYTSNYIKCKNIKQCN